MHRPRPAAGGGARSVPHPGTSGGAQGPTFISPFQPPAGYDDLAADVDPLGWKHIEVAGFSFRVRSPQPEAITVLAVAWSKYQRSKSIKTETLVDFVSRYTHPDDLAPVLMAMADPDDERFDTEQFHDLVKGIATVGTARPFGP